MPRHALSRAVLAGAALVAACSPAQKRFAAAAQSVPTLASLISADDAEIWSNGSTIPLPPVESTNGALAPIPYVDGAPPAGADDCPTCNGGGAAGSFWNRCGCHSQLFPYITGPGNCDNWCVGPHWNVSLDGLIMFREDADWQQVIGDVGLLPDLVDQFQAGPGARLFVTGYNHASFGIQVGYEGVNDFEASAIFPGVGSLRSFEYESTLNSVEVNFIRRTETPWKPFAGVRYVEVDEDFVDSLLVDRIIPPPVSGGTPPAAFIDLGDALHVENRLMGFQIGLFRDVWHLNRWITIEPFGNGGVYLNDFKREFITRTVTTVITGDDLDTAENEFSQTTSEVVTSTRRDFTEVAWLGEAGVTAVVRLNRCVALRAGYQGMYIEGVGLGLDSSFVSGLDATRVFYHGAQFGIEYQR